MNATVKAVKDFGPEYDLVQDSQDIRATLESVGVSTEELPGFLLVLIGDAEYLEVWTCEYSVPYLNRIMELAYSV